MNIQEFITFHDLKSENLKVFNSSEAQEFSSTDKRVTQDDINIVEKNIGCKFPQNYKDFCINYGGGYFGYILILSLDEDGEWFIGNIIKRFSHFIPKDLIPFADDQAGGFYCFKVQNGEAIEDIYYIESSGSIVRCRFNDFFDFVITYAYNDV